MPIADRQISLAKRTMTSEDREKLAGLISELRARGLEIPEEMRQFDNFTWPIDKNGFFPKLNGSFYNQSESQGGFISSTSRFIAFFGGRGSGKSGAGAQKALKKISQGHNGAIINPDFENFKVSTWPEFREWIPWDMVKPAHRYRRNPEWSPQQAFTMAFVNGVRVICKGVKDPDSARGPNINWLWYDEGGRDPDGLSWQVAVASVRIGKDPQAFVTTTPRGRDHWLHKFFIKREIPEEALELFAKKSDVDLVDVYFGSIWDNEDNLDPGFMASMLAAYPSGYLREQEIEGKFVDEGGVLGDRAWFNGKIIPQVPDKVKKRLRYWDLAATEKKVFGKKRNDPDETVGCKISYDGTDFYIENQIGGFWKYKKIVDEMVRVARLDGPYVPVHIEQEPGSGGINQIEAIKEEFKKKLPAWKVIGHPPKGDKIMRANTWFAEAALGNFYLVQGNWNEGFLDQLASFPAGQHDDKVDAVSGGRACVAPFRKWTRQGFLHI